MVNLRTRVNQTTTNPRLSSLYLTRFALILQRILFRITLIVESISPDTADTVWSLATRSPCGFPSNNPQYNMIVAEYPNSCSTMVEIQLCQERVMKTTNKLIPAFRKRAIMWFPTTVVWCSFISTKLPKASNLLLCATPINIMSTTTRPANKVTNVMSFGCFLLWNRDKWNVWSSFPLPFPITLVIIPICTSSSLPFRMNMEYIIQQHLTPRPTRNITTRSCKRSTLIVS